MRVERSPLLTHGTLSPTPQEGTLTFPRQAWASSRTMSLPPCRVHSSCTSKVHSPEDCVHSPAATSSPNDALVVATATRMSTVHLLALLSVFKDVTHLRTLKLSGTYSTAGCWPCRATSDTGDAKWPQMCPPRPR